MHWSLTIVLSSPSAAIATLALLQHLNQQKQARSLNDLD